VCQKGFIQSNRNYNTAYNEREKNRDIKCGKIENIQLQNRSNSIVDYKVV